MCHAVMTEKRKQILQSLHLSASPNTVSPPIVASKLLTTIVTKKTNKMCTHYNVLMKKNFYVIGLTGPLPGSAAVQNNY
jgi:hypothetical protein